MIENLEVYFDILDSTKVTSLHEFSSETGEYICLINDNKDKMPDDTDDDSNGYKLKVFKKYLTK